MDFTFSCDGTHKVYKSRRSELKCFSFEAKQNAVLGTPRVGKMLIVPPPQASALHRRGHMVLSKALAYNGILYCAATRLFHIKRLDFRLPPGLRRNLCGHNHASLFIVLGRAER